MKFPSLLAEILLAIWATAFPAARQSQHLGPFSVMSPLGINKTLGARGDEDDGTDWAGAVYTAPPAGTKFTGVSAWFTVPESSFPATYPDYEAGIVLSIGIDGRTYTDAMLTAGVHISVTYDGKTEYVPHWQWWPTTWMHKLYNELEVRPGDEFYVAIQTTSPTTASILFENRSTGKRYSANASPSDPATGGVLRGENALWIAGNFERLEDPVPPSNFGQIKFIDMWAETGSEGWIDSSGADLLDFHFLERQIASAERVSPTEIGITYVGPK